MQMTIGGSVLQTVLAMTFNFLMATTPQDRSPHQDLGLNMIDMVNKYGYILEEHKVTTEDGYILTLFRIPSGINNNNVHAKPAVLVMHGLLCSASDWVNTGPERGLGYILADRGYDVWLGNARGNTWSTNHTSLRTDDPEFWDYSFNEIGYYDLPAKIDYIIRKTGQSKIFYIGHSQGTTSFFVMASERPEYNDKIRLMVAMAPVAYPTRMLNIAFRSVAMFQRQAEWASRFFGVYQLLPHSSMLSNITDIACRDGSPYQQICHTLFFSMGGFNHRELDKKLLPVIMSNFPAGASMKQMFHYTQMINADNFEKYNYGMVTNLIRYGQRKPPSYDLKKVKAPIAFYYSVNDWLSTVYDVNMISSKVANTVLKYKMPDKKFNHFDFMWAKKVVPKLYEPMMKFMFQF